MNTLACPSEQNDGIAFSLGERLRTIGQGLESLHVEDFELRTEGDGYFALGIPSAAVKNDDADGHISQFGVNRVLLKAWHSLIGRDAPERKFATPGSNVLRILFTAEGMLRLEHQGKLKRNSDSAGVPNLNKVSQVLRLVGECIDEKAGRLIAVEKYRDRISFEYGTASDNHVREEWKLADLYEFWLEVSNRRRARYDIAERALAIEADKLRSER